jgi:D-alanyl-D-alanine carboxypeptidase
LAAAAAAAAPAYEHVLIDQGTGDDFYEKNYDQKYYKKLANRTARSLM